MAINNRWPSLEEHGCWVIWCRGGAVSIEVVDKNKMDAHNIRK